MSPSSLVRALAALSSRCDGPQLLIGPVALARALQGVGGPMVFASTGPALHRLARQTRAVPTIRTPAHHVPIGSGALGAVIASDALTADDAPRRRLDEWRRVLRPGGLLVLAQREARRPTRSFRRLLGRREQLLAAEDLTCLLLNAGFSDIRQVWPRGARAVVTSGRMRSELPSA
jgi:SAM-dependent methyltransferase